MEITLYNTCPAEYDKKFSQILKKVIRPAIRAGKSVRVDEIPEATDHHRRCNHLNHKGLYCPQVNKMKPGCRSCKLFKQGNYARSNSIDARTHSDTTMKITIKD